MPRRSAKGPAPQLGSKLLLRLPQAPQLRSHRLRFLLKLRGATSDAADLGEQASFLCCCEGEADVPLELTVLPKALTALILLRILRVEMVAPDEPWGKGCRYWLFAFVLSATSPLALLGPLLSRAWRNARLGMGEGGEAPIALGQSPSSLDGLGLDSCVGPGLNSYGTRSLKS